MKKLLLLIGILILTLGCWSDNDGSSTKETPSANVVITPIVSLSATKITTVVPTTALKTKTVSCTEIIHANNVISDVTYDGDLVSGWEFQLKHPNGFMPHGCQIVSSDDGYPTRDGIYSLRFEVRDGDCNSNQGWNDCETDRSRHELTQAGDHLKDHQYEGDEFWYKWSMLMPDNPIKRGKSISFIGQFNSDNAARFYMEDFSKGVGYRFNDVDYNILEQNILIENKYVRSSWTDIEIHALWASTDEGFIKIYVNEELIRTVKGPNMEGTNRIFFDFGIYNAFLSQCDCRNMPTQVVYFDGIRRGTSRLDVQ